MKKWRSVGLCGLCLACILVVFGAACGMKPASPIARLNADLEEVIKKRDRLSVSDVNRALDTLVPRYVGGAEDSITLGIILPFAEKESLEHIVTRYMARAQSSAEMGRSVAIALALLQRIEAPEGKDELILPNGVVGNPDDYSNDEERKAVVGAWKAYIVAGE